MSKKSKPNHPPSRPKKKQGEQKLDNNLFRKQFQYLKFIYLTHIGLKDN